MAGALLEIDEFVAKSKCFLFSLPTLPNATTPWSILFTETLNAEDRLQAQFRLGFMCYLFIPLGRQKLACTGMI